MPYSPSGTESLCKDKPSNLVTDLSSKVLSAQSSTSLPHHTYNLGRSIFLKRSRHHYGHQYSRRNSLPAYNHPNASTSHCTTTLSRPSPADTPHPENRKKGHNNNRTERIRSSSSMLTEAITTSEMVVKMVCGLCHKLLRRKPYFVGDALSGCDFSVVAVLVCGHVYHADCLEDTTLVEDKRDPPCPLCIASST